LIGASTRYLPHIVVLLVLAALPTWLHRTSSLDVEDCADLDALLSMDGGEVVSAEALSEAALESKSLAQRKLFLSQASADGRWAEGIVPLGEDDEALDFVLVRSFDAKLLYHWPAARLHWEGGKSLRIDRNELETVDSLPVHRSYYDNLDARSRQHWVVAYLLVYDSRPISNPYLAQLLSAPVQLVRGRSPMWLFFVSGRVDASRRESAEQAARRWLVAAWEHYDSVCRS
jgi:hypothetical protein